MMARNGRRQRGTGSVEDRGSYWRIRINVNGETHRYRKPKTMTADEVRDFAEEESKRLSSRLDAGLPGPMPVSDLLDRYEEVKVPRKSPTTRRTYGISLAAFRTFFVDQGRNPRAHEIRPGHVQAFLQWRETHQPNGTKCDPLSARTLAKDRAVLHAVFSFGETLEIVPSNPVAKVDVPEGDSREPLILDADQYEALLTACEDRSMLSLYVLVLGEAGLRCESEALWLRWQDVDHESGLLTVETVRKGRRTKSGKSRRVPMTQRLRKALQDHAAKYRMQVYHGERSEWIFHHETDRRRAKAGERIGSLRRGFDAAVSRAKLPSDLNMHDLRHRRVTEWLRAGKPAHIVQKAMGHADLRTTMGYSHLVGQDLMSLVEEPTLEELKEMAK
jgi:site-specific recombinase XerD